MRIRLDNAAAACLALVAVLALMPVAVGAAPPFRVVAFAGASNLAIWVGQDHGFFARRGLDVRREQVQQDRARLIAFTGGFHDSVAWLTDPAQHSAVVALLVKHMPSLSPEAAEKASAALLDPVSGIYRDLHISRAGLQTVLALRSKYGVPHKELTNPDRYVDRSIAEAALAAP